MTIAVKWDQLVHEKQLSDKDKIAVQVQEGKVNPDQIQIELVLGAGVTWWKGLQASEIILCQCQDSQTQSSATIAYNTFLARTFTLYKAKAFGAHTPMYHIEKQNDHMIGGNTYRFHWVND